MHPQILLLPAPPQCLLKIGLHISISIRVSICITIRVSISISISRMRMQSYWETVRGQHPQMLPAPSQSFLKIRFSVKGTAQLLFLMFAYRQQKVCPPCFLLSGLQTSAKSQNLLKISISTTDIGIILIQLKALNSAIKNSLRQKQKPEK